MANKQLTAEAVEHADVRGKKLYYLKVKEGDANVIINIAESTFKAVQSLLEPVKNPTK